MEGDNSTRHLALADYFVFAGMLVISAGIGVYHAYRDRRSKHGTEGYLMANRSMGVLPVAASIALNFKSSVTVLGVPGDVYQFGAMYIWTMLCFLFVAPLVIWIFIPTFYSLGISSAYEYLEKRFGKAMRLVTTIAYLLQSILYMSVNIYAPALALSGVTGFSQTAAMLSTALVCILYTTLGGLKGVIWSDVFQSFVMFTGISAFIIRGCIVMGGFGQIWEVATNGGRTNIFRFQTDPKIRYTVWSVVLGGSTMWLGLLGTSQANVQRYLSVKSAKKASKALIFGCCGIVLASTMASVSGLILYAYYSECDPLTAGCVEVRDQLMPFAVMDMFKDSPGVPGLFLASVFSASLSTISSGLNAVVTVTVVDLIKSCTNWDEARYTWISKGLGLLFGAVILGMAFMVSAFGDILSIAVASNSAFIGPCLGLFLLGIWVPFVNSTGALCGFTSGIISGGVLFFGGRTLKKPNEYLGKLPVTTRSCPLDCGYLDSFNASSTFITTATPMTDFVSTSVTSSFQFEGIDNFYALSFYYIASVAAGVTIFVGLVVSLLSGGWKHRHNVDKSLVRPLSEAKIFRWLSKKGGNPSSCCSKAQDNVDISLDEKDPLGSRQ